MEVKNEVLEDKWRNLRAKRKEQQVKWYISGNERDTMREGTCVHESLSLSDRCVVQFEDFPASGVFQLFASSAASFILSQLNLKKEILPPCPV